MKANYIFLSLLLLNSCVTKKEITKNEVKKDSINIENKKTITSKDYSEIKKFISEPFKTELNIVCDSTDFNQSLSSGKNSYNITKEKGKVKIVFEKDSSSIICQNQYKVLLEENNSLKTQINSFKETNNEQVVKKPFFANLWQILFFIVFILWILGITPIFIIKKVSGIW